MYVLIVVSSDSTKLVFDQKKSKPLFLFCFCFYLYRLPHTATDYYSNITDSPVYRGQ